MGNIKQRNVKKSQAGFIAWFFVAVVLLGFAIFFLVLNKVWNEISPELDRGLQDSMPDDSSVNITETLDDVSSTNLAYDRLIPFIIIGLFIFVFLIAGTIMKSPIMIIVGIIILGVLITLAVIYSNVYNAISETDEFSDEKAATPIQDIFMKYLPWIVFIAAVGVGIFIMFRQGGTTGL